MQPDVRLPESFVSLTLPVPAPPLEIATHAVGDQVVSAALRRDAVWEPFETRLLWDCLAPGSVFADVGANIGYFTLLAAARVGEEGRVFAFEPDPDNCSLLRASLRRNGLAQGVAVEQAALADTEGEARLYLSEDNFGDHQVFAAGPARASLPIRCLRGDRYFERAGKELDLLKVDTQGSEFAVMQGVMPFLVAQRSPTRVLIELTPWSLRAAGASGRSLIELLAQLALPFWIVDHVAHRLVLSSAEELAQWCDNVDSVAHDQGFMNIFLGAAPAGWGSGDVLHPPAA